MTVVAWIPLFEVRVNGRPVASAAGKVNARAAAIDALREGYPQVEIIDVHRDEVVEVAELNDWNDAVFYGADWEEVA